MRVSRRTAVSSSRSGALLSVLIANFPPFLVTRYWDETFDAGNIFESEILDPVTGFGGDGVGESRCIADGPFAGYVNSIGPGYTFSDHCITRQVNNTKSTMGTQEYIDACYLRTDFVDAWPCIQTAPHFNGHGAISGLVRQNTPRG